MFFFRKKEYKMSCLHHYNSYILSRDLILKLSLSNIYELPQLQRVNLVTTSRYILSDRKQLLPRSLAFYLVSGQKPKIIRAKKSVASFKLKAGTLLGCQVSLLRQNMWNFLETLSQVVLPKTKNFIRIGLQEKDMHLQFGFKNFLFFPELEKKYELFEFLSGCDIVLNVRSRNSKESICLLSGLQIPCASK